MDSERESFSWHVVSVIQRLMYERQLTDAEVIRNAPVNRASFYARMHGRAPFNTDEIARVIRYLDIPAPEFLALLADSIRAGSTSGVIVEKSDDVNPSYAVRALLESDLGPKDLEAIRLLVDKLGREPRG